MAQSEKLTTEAGAMRAFEAAIERAQALSPRACRRVLDWADERVAEALGKRVMDPVVRDLAESGNDGAWAGVGIGRSAGWVGGGGDGGGKPGAAGGPG